MILTSYILFVIYQNTYSILDKDTPPILSLVNKINKIVKFIKIQRNYVNEVELPQQYHRNVSTIVLLRCIL